MTDEPVKTLGGDWVNLSVIHDYSTATYKFEIHLSIDLADSTVADTVEALVVEARDAGDLDASKLKKELRALARAMEAHEGGHPTDPWARSRRQIINGIMVKPK